MASLSDTAKGLFTKGFCNLIQEKFEMLRTFSKKNEQNQFSAVD
jgi:hypothetical protein